MYGGYEMMTLGWAILTFFAIGMAMALIGLALILIPIARSSYNGFRNPTKLEWFFILLGVAVLAFSVAPLSAGVMNTYKYMSGKGSNYSFCNIEEK